jgi:hypothetical protein
MANPKLDTFILDIFEQAEQKGLDHEQQLGLWNEIKQHALHVVKAQEYGPDETIEATYLRLGIPTIAETIDYYATWKPGDMRLYNP